MTRDELVLERGAIRQLNPGAVVRDTVRGKALVSSHFRNEIRSAATHMMTVPRRTTLRPNETSPATVKWSTSSSEGIVLKRFWNCATCRFTVAHVSARHPPVWGCGAQPKEPPDARTWAQHRRLTFLNASPSLTTGVDWNIRSGFILS